MKKNELQDMRGRSIADLQKTVVIARTDIARKKLEMKMGKLANTSEVKNARKKIAVLQTIIRQMELGGKK